MLIQSHEEYIRLLPACLKSWSKGSLTGVRARGGFQIDFEWENGKIKEPVIVHSILGKSGAVLFPEAKELVKFEGKGVHAVYST